MISDLSRREFLAQAGIIAVGLRLGAVPRVGSLAARAAPAASQLDSWLTVGADGSITVFCGKVELGTGVSTALRQIVAEELDAPFDRIAWVQGDSDRTVDQGSTVGSQTVKRGGAQLRQAAAEARAVLLQLASAKLGAPVDTLVIDNGVVAVRGALDRRTTFAALIGGKRFEREVTGKAATKRPNDYRVVGKPIKRVEIPAKMTGRHKYVHDLRIDGMLHGRVVRPTAIGAKLESVDERSISDIPGARVVRKGDFVGVVADREEDAIRAAKNLQVAWSSTGTLPAPDELYETLKTIAATDRPTADAGNVPAALGLAAKTVKAQYRWPFQMHASIGPSCAIADVKRGAATIYSSTQGAHALKGAIAGLLGLPADGVHVVWTEGSGCYGHNGSDDAAADAALLSQSVGRPVRVQWSRADEHGWEPKGVAMLMEIAGGIDGRGRIIGWDYSVWTPTHSSRPSAQAGAASFVAGQLAGATATSRGSLGGERNAKHTYDVPSTRVISHLLQSAPLRVSSFRGLGSPQNSFANESFMDELAFAAGADPVEFRLRHLSDPRAIAVLEAVAKLAKWEARPRTGTADSSTPAKKGRGVGYVQYEGTEAHVAAIVDVEVDAQNSVRVRRAYVAHDCALIVNPDGLRNQIEGNVIQAISRTLKESVKFDRSRVTSVDWRSYPILTFAEVPESIEIELIDHPELPSVGAGEASTSPIPGAIANAIFDATGKRVREVPLRLPSA